MAKRLCLSRGTYRLVFSPETLEHLGWRSVRSPALKNGVGCVFNCKLDFLSSRISSEKGYQYKGCIESRCHAGSADDVAVHRDPCSHKFRAVVTHQVPCRPVCRHLSSHEHAGGAT